MLSSAFRAQRADVLVGLRQGLLLGIATAVLLLPSGVHPLGGSKPDPTPDGTIARIPTATSASDAPRLADFGNLKPSPDARAIADWVADSRDNQGRAFALLDKRSARLYVFDRDAGLLGSAMVLLGSAIGDDTLPSVRDKPLSEVLSHERTTPAGRFVSEPGRDETGDDVVWLDYDAAVALHRVKVMDPRERRFERIATSSAHDKRISNGCVNVPIAFFDTILKPALGASRPLVYVLPDVKPLQAVFPTAYGVRRSSSSRDDKTAWSAPATRLASRWSARQGSNL